MRLVKRLSDVQLAFILVAVFNIGGGIWAMWYRDDATGAICLFVGCLMLITARSA